MEAAGTESLRDVASSWSLAGDKQLLDVLNNIHESLVSRCQDTNRKLGEMTASLDDAAISLQNVNNTFMALSNSQFIESRVYDDDVDVVASTEKAKEPPKPPDSATELEKIRQSIKILESMHEPIHILRDSDSETDTEDEGVGRLVLKPKDLYADRPLPYIIGSTSWKSKWHAGLLPDDSDSDSSVSKHDREDEQYSDSEPEITNIQTDKQDTHNDRTVSTTSSELASEQDVTPVKPSPSEVAAELARRLGGAIPRTQESETEYAPEPTIRKVYKPEQPQISTIFSDEPPPIETYSDEDNQYEDDIFAELHKSKPYANSNKEQSRVTHDLFGPQADEDAGDMFSGVKEPPRVASQKPSLYNENYESELFAPPQPQIPKQDVLNPTDGGIKKPVGGISLFGSNKGNEIGAAILNRNRRQSSTDEDTGSEEIGEHRQESRTKEKDIFDDLFAKSEKEQRKMEKSNSKVAKENIVKVDNKPRETKKVDLFNDLFDDIDDIFTTNTTNVPIKEPNKNKKSIFDDDDDNDLFSDIPVKKTIKQDAISSSNVKTSIFDSEDELFSERSDNKTVIDKVKDVANDVSGNNVETNKKQTKIFDDDSDNDIFNTGNVKPPQLPIIDNKDTNKSKTLAKESDLVINDSSKARSSLFDDEDDDGDDLFKTSTLEDKNAQIRKNNNPDKANTNIINNIIRDEHSNNHDKSAKDNVNSTIVKKDEHHKKSVFDDDSGDELFTEPPRRVQTNSKNTDEADNYITKSNLPNENDLFSNINKTPHSNLNKQIDSINSDEAKKAVTKSNLSDENDDLFSNMKTKNGNNIVLSTESKDTSEQSNDAVKPNSGKDYNIESDNTNNEIKPIEKESQIFDDEWEDDLFEKPTDSSNKKLLPGTKLFDNESDNIFDTKQSKQADTTIGKVLDTKSQSILDDKSTKDTLEESNKNLSIVENKDIEPIIIETNSVVNSEIIPEIGKINPEIKNKDSQIFDYDDSQDDLFRRIPVNKEKTTEQIEKDHVYIENKNIESLTKEIEQPLTNEETEKDILQVENNNNTGLRPENTSSFLDDPNFNDKVTENDTLFQPPQITVFNKPDVFSDIFSEPPEFEKPKEPKKSKNVNALFDDDSDDEALFFKKSDHTLDEIPDASPVSDNRLFGIFHDEPPAIDVDFEPTKKKDHNDLFTDFDEADNNLFSKKPKPVDVKTKSETNQSTSLDTHKESKETKSDIKKPVGKLKTMNFNIDVSALLPGASPKKIKPVEQKDGQSFSTSEENVHTKDSNEETESKLVKSVSFEGDPDSNVLDNKLSKERAKIQVKRRPSTRRARREAVRKSAIDFGDNDSTDNSSSIDDPPKTVKIEVSGKQEMDNEAIKSDDTDTKSDTIDSSIEVETKPKDVKSKVVYVLHDEDIFTNIDTNQTLQKNKVLNIVDDDELFKQQNIGVNTLGNVYKEGDSSADKSNNLNIETSTDNATVSNYNRDDRKNIEVETIDNANTAHTETDKLKATIDTDSNTQNIDINKQYVVPTTTVKKSIFDDLSDEESELFGKNKSKVKDNTIFDSDSDGELFGRRSVREKIRVDVKKSLFSDDDEDDDLFGAKTKTAADIQVPPSRQPTKEVTKTTEPVFEDPLSLLGDEDD